MGGLEFALILMFSNIATLYFENFVSAAGYPNVTMIKKGQKVWCVAQEDAATSALAWTSKNYRLNVAASYFAGETSDLDCNFMKPETCTEWSGWKQSSSLEHPVPPLFDYRWNAQRRKVNVAAKGEYYFLM
ncbi:uncharacterized protein LOC110836221 [Zootermopsis nevadensis]|uniref:uncharacterized protein LOC110836221 n=1 Tax=Zootermopsis nevadensis TaxID=136037 RepID=UPI000B8E34FA|nr:uncharacterized protein LOC110836221 [Zootermopsis nevadensis]